MAPNEQTRISRAFRLLAEETLQKSAACEAVQMAVNMLGIPEDDVAIYISNFLRREKLLQAKTSDQAFDFFAERINRLAKPFVDYLRSQLDPNHPYYQRGSEAPRKSHLSVLLTEKEHASIYTTAESKRMTVSSWGRQVLLEALK